MFFGTGTPPPWDHLAENPFATLPPRLVQRIARRERPELLPGRNHVTNVTPLSSPMGSSREQLLAPGETPEGRLELSCEDMKEEQPIGALALERGVLLGREDRCCGRLKLPQHVSRVHALVLRLDGALLLIDAGSRNGTWRGHEEIRCAPLESGIEYRLSEDYGATLRWMPAH